MKWTRVLGLAVVALAAACSDNPGGGAGGGNQLLLTDSPFPYDRIARVDMHIVRVQVAASADTSDPSGQGWTTMAAPGRTFNLLDLQGGITTALGTVDAMSVGAVRVVINTALSSITDKSGQPVAVHWPVSGEMAIHAYVQQSLALFTPDTPHNLVIDFDVGRSFEDLLGDGSLYFIPWIRVLDDAGTGSLEGVVRGLADDSASYGPLANVAVTVLAGSPDQPPYTWWKVATGRTDAAGRYKVAFLYSGPYIVRAEPPSTAVIAGCMDTTDVLIQMGQSTTLDFDLPLAPGTCARSTSGGGGPDSTGNGGPDTTGTDTTTVGGPVASVTVSVWPQSPVVGDSMGAYANLKNAAGASLYGRAVTWTVSDTSVASIGGIYGQSLLLWAKKAGTTTVTAESEGQSDSRVVTIH